MVFSSPIFVFAFLPAFLLLYYAVPERFRTATLLVASCVFYGWWQANYLVLVLGIAVVSYVAADYALKLPSDYGRRWAVRLGVLCNLLILGWFKYAYFLTDTFTSGFERIGINTNGTVTLPEIILPIGLSFLVFQSISYILDVSRGDAPPASRIVDFLAFSTLFPQLIAGPILRYKDLAHQFQTRSHSLENFTKGCQRFVTGLAMKLLIADSVAPLSDRMFGLAAPSLPEAWLGAVAYAIQLFFDFAGYSAMAIGLGLMLGFRFIENFNAPYISRSVTEFWRRWHISLSAWLRDYLYVPLGGNRGPAWKTYRNLVLTMVLGGLWHGANWTFVIWGLWHGGIMALERALGAKHKETVWPKLLAWPLTMTFVLMGWVVFRAETLPQAMSMFEGMAGMNGVVLSGETRLLLRPTEVIFLVLGVMIALLPMWREMTASEAIARPASQLWHHLAPLRTAILFCCSAAIMLARTESPFLYFQF
ncbi:MBOAT family protein [Shimia sp. R11_0]|uniref:MBOAT family O-acyltransferase n=1 Tax=Shimia sp. R11_0 TaxID=2821096 RepID=UPI001ADCF65F|nr:MBOAT family protein [Shimia sp. R11_0]MBO9476724.1 MBOAT family protein [Shimia sp. R11_0]